MKKMQMTVVVGIVTTVCSVALALGLGTSSGGVDTTVSKDPKAGIKSDVLAFHGELAKMPKPTLSSSDLVSASLVGPDACGKTFTTADVITKGIRLALNGRASVKKSADKGTYLFYTFMRIRDQNGKLIKESASQTKLNHDGSMDVSADFGFLEIIKSCYCEATKLQVESSVSSIGPTGNFILHQYKTCDVQIDP